MWSFQQRFSSYSTYSLTLLPSPPPLSPSSRPLLAPLQDGELFWKRVKDLINGSDKYKKKPGLLLVDEPDNPWMYEIVSNPRNGLDVDKFDYLQRDSHHTGVKLGVDFSRLLRYVFMI